MNQEILNSISSFTSKILRKNFGVFCNRKVQKNAKKSTEVCHPNYFSLFSFR